MFNVHLYSIYKRNITGDNRGIPRENYVVFWYNIVVYNFWKYSSNYSQFLVN
jgi:hypothetical protein